MTSIPLSAGLPSALSGGEPARARTRWRPERTPGALHVVLFEVSLATTTLPHLESAAGTVTAEWVEAQFDDSPDVQEAALLRTCHRVGIFLLLEEEAAAERWSAALPGPTGLWCRREGGEAILYAHRVAAGLESLAVGEREVREQVRLAGRTSWSRHPRPVLRELLFSAVDGAETLAGPSRSIAALAAARLVREVTPESPRVVVVGVGVVGRRLAELLGPVARLTLLYRRLPPAPEFLSATGAEAAPIESLAEVACRADAVITAAKSSGRIMGPSDLRGIDHPLVIIDLGLPRNVDPEVASLPHVRLLDLAALREERGNAPGAPEIEARVQEIARLSQRRIDRLLLEPWVAQLMRAAEEIRESETEAAGPFLGALTADQREAVERLTRRLVIRLVGPPAERLRSLPAGDEEERLRRFALELFRPSSDDP